MRASKGLVSIAVSIGLILAVTAILYAFMSLDLFQDTARVGSP
jgi:hypothetical protein